MTNITDIEKKHTNQPWQSEPPILDSLYYRAWVHLMRKAEKREEMPGKISTHEIQQQILAWASEYSVHDLFLFLDSTDPNRDDEPPKHEDTFPLGEQALDDLASD